MIAPSNEFWQIFKNTNGALSCTEAIAIMNLAAKAPEDGSWLELGTYRGKSCLAASCARVGVTFHLVDPEFNDDRFLIEVDETVSRYCKPLFMDDFSINVIGNFDELGYVFVDSGSHQDGLPMQEVKLLEDRMIKDGIIAFHDWGSQFKEVKEASDYLVRTGKYEYIFINWDEIIDYVKTNDLERNNRSWHHSELDYPAFVGAVKRK